MMDPQLQGSQGEKKHQRLESLDWNTACFVHERDFGCKWIGPNKSMTFCHAKILENMRRVVLTDLCNSEGGEKGT